MEKQKYLAEMILSVVADVTGTTKEELKGKCRKDKLAGARGIFCVVCSDYHFEQDVIVKTIRRNRTTAYYYIKTHKEFIKNDKELEKQYRKVKIILRKIKNTFFENF